VVFERVPVREWPVTSAVVVAGGLLQIPGTDQAANVVHCNADWEAVVVLPAASRAKAVRVCEPFVAETVFQLTEYGEVVSSVPRLAPSSLNWTQPLHIVRGIRRHTEPRQIPLPRRQGFVTETVGELVSVELVTVTVIVLVAVFPAASRATAEMVCDPIG